MIVLAKGNAAAPEQRGQRQRGVLEQPQRALGPAKQVGPVQDGHEDAAIDHPLLGRLDGDFAQRGGGENFAVDRRHDHARDQVNLGPQSGLRKDGGGDGDDQSGRRRPGGRRACRSQIGDPRPGNRGGRNRRQQRVCLQ